MEYFLLLIKLIASLSCGILLLFIFGQIISYQSNNRQPTYWEDLESDFVSKRMVLNNEMIGIIYQIKSKQDGTEERKNLWDLYFQKDIEYNTMFEEQTDILINKRRA